MANRIAVLACGILLLSSCSVREDRGACPCTLHIALRDIPGPVTVQLVLESGTITLQAARDTVFSLQVPRGQLRLLASCGATPGADEALIIPPGYDCPPVFMYSGWVNTDFEETKIEPRLRKHFCTLSLRMDGPSGWGEPYWTRVRGRAGGLDWDGTPVEGEFSCRLDAGMSVRLPRQQAGGELWLDIVTPGGTARSFALGNYMEEEGYDWMAQDLEDLSLTMQLSLTEIILGSSLWQENLHRYIEL